MSHERLREFRRLGLFSLIVVLVGTGGVRAAERPADQRPNLLFIFADDQCYQTVHSLGCDEIQTPNLDRLVRSGLVFTHSYNQGSWTGAVCIASRTMLNTGRSLWHAQQVDRSVEKERQAGRLWSEILRGAGYDTYFTGKWHVKVNAEKAFDHVTHVRPGMPNQTPQGYDRPIEGQPDVWKPWDRTYEGHWKGGKHWSEVLGDDALDYLKTAAKSEKPFFMYLAFNAPHDPRQSPKAFVDRYPLESIELPINFLPEYPFQNGMGCGPTLRDEKLAPFPRTPYAVKVNRQEYYAIITHMDAQVGRILDALEATGKADNTYIFFSADHGLACGQHGLMGKQNLFDHSVRMPFMVVGPGVAKGTRNETPIYLQDIMPTTLELAGVEKPAHVEFKSLLPMMRGRKVAHYDAVYGAYRTVQRMVTVGDFKMILYPDIRKVLLFNLKDDPHEMHNLAEGRPYRETLRRLFRTLLELQREMGDELDVRGVYPRLAGR